MTCIVCLINGGSPFAIMLNKPTKAKKRVIETLDPDRAAYLIAAEKKRREQRKQDRRA